ncbi:MAG TPA: DUF5063 domain-containing protein [Verrucomicrobiae bacterium]|nr:DUF5063 domain-containing protein [Verrucomicrobiae bacterium]
MSTPPNNAEVADRFASVAREFCSAIDAAPNTDRIELLVRVYRILPQLISEAVGLPKMELRDDESPEEESRERQARVRLRLSDAQWGQLYEFLKVKLGDFNLYWEVWDPTKDSEAIRGSLADDFADIYRDLKEQLNLSEAHEAQPEDNIWHWRVGYHSHWGKHAIDALRTIHFLLYETLD